MVPDATSTSRRRFLGGLAGLAGLAGGATMIVGATEPTALPDAVTDWATKEYPTPPEVNSLWRPTVTEDHARTVVSLLEDVTSEGNRLWKRVGDDPDHFHTGAGGWLETAREELRNGNYHEALFDATYGMQFAAEDLGYARAKLGNADLQRLGAQGADVLDRVEALTADLRPHPVADPGRDLAWYVEIENELLSARHHVERYDVADPESDTDGGAGTTGTKYDPNEIGTTTAGLMNARIAIENAERWYDHLSGTLDGPTTTPYGDHLLAVAGEFRDEVETFPTQESIESKHVDNDSPYGPYEFARSRLADWCLPNSFPSPWGAEVNDTFPVLEAVGYGTGVARGRAHEFAVEHLVVDPGDDGFDSGHALAEKRRARRAYRSTVGSDPPPFLTRLVGRAVEDLQVAKVGFAGSYRDVMWKERLEAYLYALVGRAKIWKFPAVYRTIVERS
ncbi:MAG TPA: hypothetical protein VJ898_04625 [Natrialbaceae archaeon]|nr:hypothetical protein [Natrialbaceae archaeon]